MNFTRIIAILLSAGIHELGHVLAARSLGVRLSGFSLKPTEARLYASGLLSYGKEWAIAAAGPFANLTASLLFIPLSDFGYFVNDLVFFSLAFAVLNLLPIAGFDGGRMVYCLASLIFRDAVSRAISQVLSFISIVGLWMISVYFLIKTASAISLFMFSVTLFRHLKEQ